MENKKSNIEKKSNIDNKLINYKDVINFFENFFYKYTKNNALSGFIVYLLHVGICSVAAFYIILGNKHIQKHKFIRFC